ncbi:MAG: helix-turn-helix domain-containing protein [Chthoniobacteraceae bacterium]
MNFLSLRRIPTVCRTAVNQGASVTGSFIDSEWVFHYIVAGEWLFELESQRYVIGPGDLVLIPPRLLHVVRATKGAKRIHWVIHFEMHGAPLPPIGGFPYAVSSQAGIRSKIESLFTMVFEDKNSAPDHFAGGVIVSLLALYFRLERNAKPVQSRTMASWGAMEAGIRFMQENSPRQGLRLADISHAAGLSPEYLCRVFKQCFGVSVMHYLTSCRLQKAEELLLNSSKNCTEIAEAIGFESVHSLSRIFHKMKGIPPMRYRQMHSGR